MGAKFSRNLNGLPAGLEKRIEVPLNRIELLVDLVKPRQDGVGLALLQLAERLVEKLIDLPGGPGDALRRSHSFNIKLE